MTTPKQSRIEEIKARLAKATPGEWGFPRYSNCLEATSFAHYGIDPKKVLISASLIASGDMEFLASAPADIAWLLARCERLQAVLEWYADSKHWTIDWVEGSHGDYGNRARKALAEGEEGGGK